MGVTATVQKEVEVVLNKYVHDLDGVPHWELREAVADVVEFYCNPEATVVPTWRDKENEVPEQEDFVLEADELYVLMDVLEFYTVTMRDSAKWVEEKEIEDSDKHIAYVQSIFDRMVAHVNSQTEEV